MDIKDYILTSHARARMKERRISEEEINHVLSSPEITYPGKRGETNVIKTIKKGKRIRVTYITEGNKIIIVTAMVLD